MPRLMDVFGLTNVGRATAVPEAEAVLKTDPWSLVGDEQEQRDAANSFKGMPAVPYAAAGAGGVGAAANLYDATREPGQGPITRADLEREHQLSQRAERKQAMASGGKRGDVYQMSWEDYQALTAQQRAAVDFNTMLVRAVRKDLRQQETYDPSVPGRAQYDDAVTNMFGADHGSKTYAPQTMALLQQIGFNDTNADLDDFLKLRAAITDKDLKGVQLEAVPGLADQALQGASATAQERATYVDAVSEATMTKMRDLMQSSEVLLQTPIATAVADPNRNAAIELFGGKANNPKAMLGFGLAQRDPATGEAANMDAYFQDAFSVLANKGTTEEARKQMFAAMDVGMSDEQWQQFMSYVDTRSRLARDTGRPLGVDPKVQYRSPEEFRKLLGLEQ